MQVRRQANRKLPKNARKGNLSIRTTFASPEYRFDSSDDRQREGQIRKALAQVEDYRSALKCAACGLLITYRDAAIIMSGCHARRFNNPSGYSFHVGCFGQAPGCSQVGTETEEHSWFPGYAWIIAVCTGCGAHIGWRFRCGTNKFYGLILDRLVPQPSD